MTEHNVETYADPGAILGIWSDVTRWPEWNADLERAEISVPFGVGSRVTMFLTMESRSSCRSQRLWSRRGS
jgi:hypothetical protein